MTKRQPKPESENASTTEKENKRSAIEPSEQIQGEVTGGSEEEEAAVEKGRDKKGSKRQPM